MSSRWLLSVALPCLALVASNGVAGAIPSPPPATTAAKKPAPLDLSVGDISRYVDAAELATPLREELEEIIVNGQRPEPLPEHRAIPHSVPGALYYAATHPLAAWRILVPDPYFEIPDRSVDDARDPPGAFRGRILEPGAIYD